MDISKIKMIAYYLPQFYELDVNIPVYGKGYTEWTRTANAKPLFKGYYQQLLNIFVTYEEEFDEDNNKIQRQMNEIIGVPVTYIPFRRLLQIMSHRIPCLEKSMYGCGASKKLSAKYSYLANQI